MKVNKAEYACFRNLQNVSIEFSGGVNVLWGMNAQGKSNILEGIYYFARGRSFRGAKDVDLVKFGEEAARFGITFTHDGSDSETKLSAAISSAGRKKLYRNGANLRGAAEMLGNFRAVMFCPSHLSIVSGGPAERRAFLDIAIAQNSSRYVYYLSNYRRFLAERNALLKRAESGVSVSKEEWETYAEQLSVAASEIFVQRDDYCKMLTGDVSGYFRDMTGGAEQPELIYVSHVGSDADTYSSKEAYRAGLFEKLTNNVERECAAGSTLWGPHKDDVSILINGKEAKLYASQGQQRSVALAMKLAEGEISRRMSGEYPVFLLDDVFSELDAGRRAFIMECLRGRQIIVTSCEPSVIPDGDGEIAFFEVKGGETVG